MKSLTQLLAFGALLNSAVSAPSATLDSGVIIGTTTSLPSATAKVNKFLGIPFAQPPLGDLRFAPPKNGKSWSKPKKTTAYAPACIQQFNYPAAARNFTIEAFNTPPPAAGESEDCLNINVWAPASAKNASVMFWIYGGGLQFGCNSLTAYDGSSFAAHQDVIVVAPNYRTNAFGFPMSPQLPLNQRNLGLLDQRLALNWVQRNIHAFGGSPDKVTIFGESAGSYSVDTLVTSFAKNPPFRGAIMESGQTALYPNLNNSNSAPWTALMKGLNCTGSSAEILACARAAPASAIKSVEEHLALPFRPVSDNITALEYPLAARAAGKIARVPVMMGNNGQEGRIFTIGDTNATLVLETLLPGLPAYYYGAILAAYPQGTPGLINGYEVISAIYTDFIFQCPAVQAANSSSTNAKIPTWEYLFNATFPNTQLLPDLGAYHSSEIMIVFGNYPRVNATEAEASLSKYMQKAWADFAKNPSSGPGWAQWPNVEVFNDLSGPAVEKGVSATLLDERCALYQPIYAIIEG